MKAVLYVHGKGGSAAERDHYMPLFPECDVTGLDYKTFTPWETGEEIAAAVRALRTRYDAVILIANSIGAYFALCSGAGDMIEKAYFISPVTDMERMILGMMAREGITEEELARRGVIVTGTGDELSAGYLSWVRSHPVKWTVPTAILYGGKDELVPREAITAFAGRHGATVTVMEGAEHWFHTPEQMRFLDDWIRNV